MCMAAYTTGGGTGVPASRRPGLLVRRLQKVTRSACAKQTQRTTGKKRKDIAANPEVRERGSCFYLEHAPSCTTMLEHAPTSAGLIVHDMGEDYLGLHEMSHEDETTFLSSSSFALRSTNGSRMRQLFNVSIRPMTWHVCPLCIRNGFLYTYLHMCASICLSIYRFAVSLSLSTYQSIYPSIHPTLPTRQLISPCVYPTIHAI